MPGLPAGWPDVTVCCVWLPLLPLRVAVLQHPEWDGLPLVLGGAPGERKVVQCCSPEAERAGLQPGLPLREVLARCADAVVVQPDPEAEAMALKQVIEGLQLVSPDVEVQSEHLYVNLRGLRALHHGELALLDRALRAAVPLMLQPRIGMAGNKFTARAAAEAAAPRGTQVVPAGDTVGFLAALPVALLPLSTATLQRMDVLGLRTIGELAALPFSAVQAEFGKAGARAWRLAHGQDDEPVLPYQVKPTVAAGITLDDPLSSIEGFHTALRMVLGRAFGDPSLHNRSVRRVRLSAQLSTGASWEQLLVFKGALMGRDAVFRALKDKLEVPNALPPAPFETLAAELTDLGAETGKQPSIFAKNVQQEQQLAEATRQLQTRYQTPPVYHAVEVEPWSRIPERRWALMPFDP